MTFDTITERAGTHQSKWSAAEAALGLRGPDALPMWIADMDFDVAPFLAQRLQELAGSGILGYFTGLSRCSEALAWWLEARHGWTVDPGAVLHAHGIGNAIALCLQCFSAPGDEVIVFTPVYPEFAAKIGKAGRKLRECPLVPGADGRFYIDFDALEAGTTGRERIMLISSPHNPAGRLWTEAEQQRLAAYCARHDLILLSDEIHQDLVFPGECHVPMAVSAPEIVPRLVTLAAASKTFNTAGLRHGCLVVPDAGLREQLKRLLAILDLQPNIAGVHVTEAAYSPEGAAWADALVAYLAQNARVFSDGIAAIPGLRAMPMQSTYLAWVDFTPLGLSPRELRRRVIEQARIGPSFGADFGTGGEGCLRFNLGTQRARVEDAAARLQRCLADLA